MIKAFIFDYGGTIDTQGCHWGMMLWHAYERHAVPVSELSFREAYVYAERKLGSETIVLPTDTFHETLRKKIGIELDYLVQNGCLKPDNGSLQNGNGSLQNEINSLRDALVDDLYQQTREIVEDSKRTLRMLNEHYPLILVSNFYGNLQTVVDEFGLSAFFRKVIESAQVNLRKPDPRILQLALNILPCSPSEVCVVGDSIKNDIRPAHSLGCKTIHILGEPWTVKQEIDESDWQIDRLSEIHQLPLTV